MHATLFVGKELQELRPTPGFADRFDRDDANHFTQLRSGEAHYRSPHPVDYINSNRFLGEEMAEDYV